MKKQLTYILFTCLLVTSCRKNELPKPEEQGQPVFYFKGDVNGLPVKIEAGVDNYVMNSSHYQDNNNLYIYKSELKQTNCTSNCGFALTVLINDAQIAAVNGAMNTNDALVTGTHGFNDGSLKAVSYKANFTSFAPANIPGDPYIWTYVNGPNSFTVRQKNLDRNFEAGEQISVNFLYDDPAGIGGTLTKDYKIGSPLQANIAFTNNKFSANFTGNPTKYTWDFGDSTTPSTEVSPEHTYPPSTLEYVATLKLEDANGNTCISKYLIDPDCGDDANFDATFTPFINPKLASGITLLFTDQNGFTYSSAELNQPTASKFESFRLRTTKTMTKMNQPKK